MNTTATDVTTLRLASAITMATMAMVSLPANAASYSPNNTGPFPSLPSASGTPYAGDGSTAGTPGFVIVDRSSGAVSIASATQMSALIAGGMIQQPPTTSALTIGAVTYATIAYSTSAPASPASPPFTYQALYRLTGTTAWTPATAVGSSALTGTIQLPLSQTAQSYDVELVTAGPGGQFTSAPVTVATPAPPPSSISSATLAANGLTLSVVFNEPVTLTASGLHITSGGNNLAFTDSDAGTPNATHVLTLASPYFSSAPITLTTASPSTVLPATSAAVSGQAITNNSTVTFAYTFPGTAGSAPTGNSALTALTFSLNNQTSLSNVTLDGAGNVQLSSEGNAYGTFSGQPTASPSVVTANIAPNGQGAFAIIGRASGNNAYAVAFVSNVSVAVLYRYNNGTQTEVCRTPYNLSGGTSFGLGMSGSTLTIQENGVVLTTCSDSSIPAGGSVGIGKVVNTAQSAPTLISSVITQ